MNWIYHQLNCDLQLSRRNQGNGKRKYRQAFTCELTPSLFLIVLKPRSNQYCLWRTKEHGYLDFRWGHPRRIRSGTWHSLWRHSQRPNGWLLSQLLQGRCWWDKVSILALTSWWTTRNARRKFFAKTLCRAKVSCHHSVWGNRCKTRIPLLGWGMYYGIAGSIVLIWNILTDQISPVLLRPCIAVSQGYLRRHSYCPFRIDSSIQHECDFWKAFPRNWQRP